MKKDNRFADDDQDERPISLHPEDFADPDSLAYVLKEGEQEEDFRYDHTQTSSDPPVRYPGVVVEGLVRVLDDLKDEYQQPKDAIIRMAVKMGLLQLLKSDVWDGLEAMVQSLNQRTKNSGDRSLIVYLEQPTTFRFAHPISRKLRAPLYHWEADRIDLVARVAGWSMSQTIVVCLVLAVVTLADWTEFFDADLKQIVRHLERRRATLDSEL